jgi:hypothetical protein
LGSLDSVWWLKFQSIMESFLNILHDGHALEEDYSLLAILLDNKSGYLTRRIHAQVLLWHVFSTPSVHYFGHVLHFLQMKGCPDSSSTRTPSKGV